MPPTAATKGGKTKGGKTVEYSRSRKVDATSGYSLTLLLMSCDTKGGLFLTFQTSPSGEVQHSRSFCVPTCGNTICLSVRLLGNGEFPPSEQTEKCGCDGKRIYLFKETEMPSGPLKTQLSAPGCCPCRHTVVLQWSQCDTHDECFRHKLQIAASAAVLRRRSQRLMTGLAFAVR